MASVFGFALQSKLKFMNMLPCDTKSLNKHNDFCVILLKSYCWPQPPQATTALNIPLFLNSVTCMSSIMKRKWGNVSVRCHHMESQMEKMKKSLLFITGQAGWTTEHNISICIIPTTKSSVFHSINNWVLYISPGQPLSNVCTLRATLFFSKCRGIVGISKCICPRATVNLYSNIIVNLFCILIVKTLYPNIQWRKLSIQIQFSSMCCLIVLKLHMGIETCHRQTLRRPFVSFIHCPSSFHIKIFHT